jgi:hypothetical protein
MCVLPEEAGLVVASGSHGGVTAAGMTRSFRPRFAFFYDASFGVDRAAAACFPILDSEGIAAATDAADSACIGDGQSTLTQGIISAVNETAYRLGRGAIMQAPRLPGSSARERKL